MNAGIGQIPDDADQVRRRYEEGQIVIGKRNREEASRGKKNLIPIVVLVAANYIPNVRSHTRGRANPIRGRAEDPTPQEHECLASSKRNHLLHGVGIYPPVRRH